MKPTRIIIHHSLTKDSGTVSWNAIRKYHMTNPRLLFKDIGYHFGIEQVGQRQEILMGRMMNVQGAHTRGQNEDSLAIGFIGNFDLGPPPADQWNLGIKLVKSLLEIFGIPRWKVFGHRNFSSKTCPGKHFDMNLFRKSLRVDNSKSPDVDTLLRETITSYND